MSAVDHRLRVKIALGAVTATLDDGVTAAQIIIVYTGSPENFKQWFYIYDYDAVITIDRPRVTVDAADKVIQSIPLRFPADVPFHVSAVDKTGLTATKLLNKIRNSIGSAVNASAQPAGYKLMMLGSSGNNQVMGGYDPLWRDDYVWQYRPRTGFT